MHTSVRSVPTDLLPVSLVHAETLQDRESYAKICDIPHTVPHMAPDLQQQDWSTPGSGTNTPPEGFTISAGGKKGGTESRQPYVAG